MRGQRGGTRSKRVSLSPRPAAPLPLEPAGPAPPTGAPGPRPSHQKPWAPVHFRQPLTLPASGFHQKTGVGPRPTHLSRASPGLRATSSF